MNVISFRIFFVAFLLASSPAWSAEEPKKPAVEKVSETGFKLGTIEFDSATREIRFPALVNAREGYLEYFLVHSNGKTHESLFKTDISPTELQIVMKLLKFKQGKGKLFHGFYPPGELPEPEEQGESIQVFVTWPGSDDIPAKRLVLDAEEDESLQDETWIYTGSEIVQGKFQAEIEGSIIALYLDSLSMLNMAHPRNDNDENWFPVPERYPAYETPVTIIFRPAKANESKPK